MMYTCTNAHEPTHWQCRVGAVAVPSAVLSMLMPFRCIQVQSRKSLVAPLCALRCWDARRNPSYNTMAICVRSLLTTHYQTRSFLRVYISQMRKMFIRNKTVLTLDIPTQPISQTCWGFCEYRQNECVCFIFHSDIRHFLNHLHVSYIKNKAISKKPWIT